MRNWKIGMRISAGFAVLMAIILALGGYAYNRTLAIARNNTVLSGNYLPSISALSQTNTNNAAVIGLILRHAASNDPAEMTDLEGQIAALHETNNKLYKQYESCPQDEAEKALYAKVLTDRPEFWRMEEEIRQLSRLATPAADLKAEQEVKGPLLLQQRKLGEAVQAVLNYNVSGASSSFRTIEGSVSSANRGIIFGVVLAIVLVVPISLYVVRSITSPLAQVVSVLRSLEQNDLTAVTDIESKDEIGDMARALGTAMSNLNQTLSEVSESADATTSSARQLSEAASSIASGAQEQAASLEETSASLEQITATVRHSADNAHQASQLASGSRDSAEKGQDVVKSAISAMQEINTASAKISDIISTIDEIAFQTNLLAVNAAVEAARAGEEGRGFAVVASEVRSLAQRSAGAAKEIKVLIQDSLRKVETGSDLVNRSGETLQGIVGSVKRVTDIVGEIAASSAEQSTGVEQVNTAVTQMDQVTQSNSAQTEELSATAQSLAEQAGRLQDLVAKFTLQPQGQHGSFQSRPVRSAAASRPQAAASRKSSFASAPTKRAAGVKPATVQKPSMAMATVSAGSHDDSFEEF